MFKPIDQNFFVVGDRRGKQQVGVQLYSRDSSYGSDGPLFDRAADRLHQHLRWGLGDNQPNLMRRLIQKNTSVRSLLETHRDMIYGSGVGLFKRNIVDDKEQLVPYTDTRLSEWSEATELSDYAISAINQRVDNANVFTRWQYQPLDDWFLLNVSDSFKTRIGRRDKAPGFRVNPYFGQMGNYYSNDSEPIPAFNRFDRDANVARTVTMSLSNELIPGQPNYAFPSWWCAEEAIELANLIIAFHKNGILNGYNIKYLIKMPQDYFDKEGGRNLDSKEIRAKWSKWGDNLSNWLSGAENVNKSMLIKYMRGAEGKAQESVIVEPLKNLMSDDAYDKVWNSSNQAITNSVGAAAHAGWRKGRLWQRFRLPNPRHGRVSATFPHGHPPLHHPETRQPGDPNDGLH